MLSISHTEKCNLHSSGKMKKCETFSLFRQFAMNVQPLTTIITWDMNVINCDIDCHWLVNFKRIFWALKEGRRQVIPFSTQDIWRVEKPWEFVQKVVLQIPNYVKFVNRPKILRGFCNLGKLYWIWKSNKGHEFLNLAIQNKNSSLMHTLSIIEFF